MAKGTNKKWSFFKHQNETKAKHDILPLNLDRSSYFYSKEPSLSIEQFILIGDKLNLSKCTQETFEDFNLAFHHYINGHNRFTNAPLKSKIRNDIKKLNSVAEELQTLLINLDNHYKNTLFTILSNSGLRVSESALFNNSSDLYRATKAYLVNYKAHKSKPNTDYLYEFIFLIGAAYFRWTNKMPTVTWDNYKDKNNYSGTFIKLVDYCFNLLNKNHRKTNIEIGQIIKKIDFSEVKYYM